MSDWEHAADNGRKCYELAITAPRPITKHEGKDMIIEITDEYRIVSDPLQWIVQQLPPVTENQKKPPQWKGVAHFGTLNSAIVWLAERRIRTLPGTYKAEALTPLCAALDAIVKDAVKARAA